MIGWIGWKIHSVSFDLDFSKETRENDDEEHPIIVADQSYLGSQIMRV
jgi:hypothetical protein